MKTGLFKICVLLDLTKQRSSKSATLDQPGMQMVSILDKLGPSSFRALKYYMLKRGILGYATRTKHSELLYDQCIYLDGGPSRSYRKVLLKT